MLLHGQITLFSSIELMISCTTSCEEMGILYFLMKVGEPFGCIVMCTVWWLVRPQSKESLANYVLCFLEFLMVHIILYGVCIFQNLLDLSLKSWNWLLCGVTGHIGSQSCSTFISPTGRLVRDRVYCKELVLYQLHSAHLFCGYQHDRSHGDGFEERCDPELPPGIFENVIRPMIR